VYQLAKRGGNKKLTLIKKVEGDRTRFQSALAQELGVEEKAVVVNNLTGHVIVKVSRLLHACGLAMVCERKGLEGGAKRGGVSELNGC
jgi:hypothetical protein